MRLLGPPVARGRVIAPPLDVIGDAPPSHPFLDLLDAGFNHDPPPPANSSPTVARTENGSATYASSGNPCVDLFFQVVPSTPTQRVRDLVAAAWAHDPLTALKLVCNLRGVRGTGKSDREGFYAAALWMHEYHPKTLAGNVPALAEFGYLKDFPELLFRLIHGATRVVVKRPRARYTFGANKPKATEAEAVMVTAAELSASSTKVAGPIKRQPRRRMKLHVPPLILFGRARHLMAILIGQKRKRGGPLINKASKQDGIGGALKKRKPAVTAVTTQTTKITTPENEEEALGPKKMEKKKELTEMTRKTARLAVQALETYYGDRAYRFLFDHVAEFLSGLLASDVERMRLGQLNKISLAAKWCPTPGSSLDKATLLCEAIARRIFPFHLQPEEEEHYLYGALRRLRREVLVPLRKALELPEVYMSARRWSDLPYTKLFEKHDATRFAGYLADVEAGKAKIAAGALLPHEIAFGSAEDDDDDDDRSSAVSELQWRRMVEDLRGKGSLSNCIAVCDVSGSMDGTPMEVCVALGLLVSELSEPPWAGRVITFSARPEIHTVQGANLREKLSFVEDMEWGTNTDFQAVFDRILGTAVDARLPPEKMIRTVFVFSDMEFDCASASPWETDYQAICRKFSDAGYGHVVPRIVFWNLRDSRSTPVMSAQPGVALVSGFSKNIVKLFLDKDGVLSPEAVMAAAIAGAEYQKLAVFD